MSTLTSNRSAAPATFRLDLNVIASIYQPMAGRERRRACRMPRHATVLMHGPVAAAQGHPPDGTWACGGPFLRAVLQDLSATGIGVVYGRALAADGPWVVGLPRPGGEPVWMWCRVMRHEEIGDSLYHVGLAFQGRVEPPA